MLKTAMASILIFRST